jgi:hypothetical protein
MSAHPFLEVPHPTSRITTPSESRFEGKFFDIDIEAISIKLCNIYIPTNTETLRGKARE